MEAPMRKRKRVRAGRRRVSRKVGPVRVAEKRPEPTLKLETGGSRGSMEGKTLEKLRMKIEGHVCVCTCMCVCVCVYACARVYMCVHAHTCACVLRNEYFCRWHLRKKGIY